MTLSDFRNFMYYPMARPKRIQPDSPVYVHAYTLAVQQQTGASFVQLRLVNRSERVVHSVFLHVIGLDALGHSCFDMGFLPLPACYAEPHTDFGEEHALFLPESNACSLEVWVEDVLFGDGMIWRKQAKHRLMTPEEAGWIECDCGMKNPDGAVSCAFCGKTFLIPVAEPEVSELPITEEMECNVTLEAEEEDLLFDDTEPVISDPEPSSAEEVVAVLHEPQNVNETGTRQLEESEEVEESEQLEVSEEVEESEQLEEPEEVEEPEQAEEPEQDEQEELPEQEDESPAEQIPVSSQAEAVPELAQKQMELLSQIFAPMESEEASEEESDGEVFLHEEGLTYMEETNRLMQELQRRMAARQNGEMPATQEPEEQQQVEDTTEQEDHEMRKANRSILFWSIMVIVMILLLLGGFFGVLYYKGYFS